MEPESDQATKYSLKKTQGMWKHFSMISHIRKKYKHSSYNPVISTYHGEMKT